MSTTGTFLVASNTGEKVNRVGSSPAQIPVFPPSDLVQAQAYHSPIHTAIYDPNIDISYIESMILADPTCLRSTHPQNGYTPLHAAVRRAHIGMIKMIVGHGADIEAKASDGETPFIVACQVSNFTFTRTWIQ